MGPTSPWKSPRAAGLGCGPRRYSYGWAISKIDVSNEDVHKGNSDKGVFLVSKDSVPFEGNVCFMFFLNVDSSPDLDFIVSIQGIRQGGEVLQIPEIRFVKGSVRKSFPIP